MAPAKSAKVLPAVSASRKREGKALSTPDAETQHVRRKTFDLDPDTLECPICSEPFSPPVYQCVNGHPACSTCWEKISKRCPSCSQPVGCIRNRAIEKIIESLQADCKYASHGCKRKLKYSEIEQHENGVCEYQPTVSPKLNPYCKHIGAPAAPSSVFHVPSNAPRPRRSNPQVTNVHSAPKRRGRRRLSVPHL